jgi:hypothetical protein
MLRFLLPSLALVLSLSANAEKLPDAQIDNLRANFSMACHTTTSLITPAWLLQGEGEQVCGCSDGKTVTRLREVEVVDANNINKAEQRRIDDIGTNAANECMQPFFAKSVERMATRQCVASASGIPGLQALDANHAKDVCACAAKRYVKTADLREIDQVAAPDSMLMQHIGDLLKSDISACLAH